jgi:hypothetical protein
MVIMNRYSDNLYGVTMQYARIIDETGRTGPWTETLREVLGAAGYGLTEPENDNAGLTVLLYPEDTSNGEDRFTGDLLVLSIPGANISAGNERSRTEVIGTHRLKARHHLNDIQVAQSLAEELRPLVNLFLN